MSIKDLFPRSPKKIISSKKVQDLELDVESQENILETRDDKLRFVPNVDFGNPAAFARYGSAEKYYEKSVERIHDEYPYDGTFAEKKRFLNESTYLDLYILDEKYPKTNGYITLSSDGWTTSTETVAATATITIAVATVDVVGEGDVISLIATDGRTITCTLQGVGGTTTSAATDGNVTAATYASSTDNTLQATAQANSIATAINNNNFFTATNSANVVTVTQAVPGATGNTAITITELGAAGMSKTDFTGGSGGAADISSEYGAPATGSFEYIRITGSLSVDSELTDITTHSLPQAFGDASLVRAGRDSSGNVYEVDIYATGGVLPYGRKGSRDSNLKFDLENDGVTVEFWLKKSEFLPNLTEREVIFDLWNKEGPEEDTYGRLRLELTGAEDGTNPFLLTCRSGAYSDGSSGGFSAVSIAPSTITTGNIADDKWHHYAVSVANSGTYSAPASATGIVIKFYRDGDLLNTIVTGSMIGHVTGSLVANIGALIAPVSASSPYAGEGWGKLSGSLDEFRYWKSQRGSKEIGRHWWSQVAGGVNTDIANAELGVYYKFNEGIVGSSSYDSVILDYSGRLANGEWIGYPGSSARNTGSAIVDSGYATSEAKDPIVYSAHPDVKELKEDLAITGSDYDIENQAQLIKYFPSYMVEEDEDQNMGGEDGLNTLTQIIASYLDTLQTQIDALPRIQDASYISSSYKPAPFMDDVLEGKGFVAPELFADAELINQILNRDEDRDFSLKLHNVKNLIYKNVYNNLAYLYKTKGTKKSFRNLIRCFGVDDELIKINLYGNNVTHLLRDNFTPTAVSKNYANFTTKTAFTASVIQHSGTYAPYAGGPLSDVSDFVVSGTAGAYASLPSTTECEVIFPSLSRPIDHADAHVAVPFLSSSLFGWHTPSGADWASSGSDYGIEVYAVRTPDVYSSDAYFLIRSRAGYGGAEDAIDGAELTSSVYKDVFSNQRWNFGVSFRHEKSNGGYDYVSGSIETGKNDSNEVVEMEFYGVNMEQDVVRNEFMLTASAVNNKYLSDNRRYYLGAHRENFNGDVQEKSFSKISSLRHWQSYLTTGTIQAHARDPLNFGARNPYIKNAQFSTVHLGGLTASVHVPEIETLALHWDFHRVTGSDESGQFFVDDASSGSVALKNEGRYSGKTVSSLNNIISTRYMGKGIGFSSSDSGSVKKEYISALRQNQPESLASEDMVSVLDFDDETFTRETRPVDYFFAFEKSMYQTISEEMLKMFATIVEFNNLIGAPVNKYRGEYKSMKKLRNLFFEKIGNTPNLDRYVSYYKWIDDALSEMIRELVPASANTSDKLRNMVESHVLERNKYRHKFPTIDMKRHGDFGSENPYSAPELPSITNPTNDLVPWVDFHAPVSKSLTSKKAWWRLRGERDRNHGETTSATATITVIDSSSPPGVPFIGEGDTIELISTDGTTVTLTMQGQAGSTTSSETSGDTLTAKTLAAGSYANSTLHATAQAVEIRTAINYHTLFAATNSNNVVTVTQQIGGRSGNTTITITELGATGLSNTNFSGGDGWLRDTTPNASDTEQNREEIRKTFIRRRRTIPGHSVKDIRVEGAPQDYGLPRFHIQDTSVPYRLTAHVDSSVVEMKKHQHSQHNARTFNVGSNTPLTSRPDFVFSSLAFGTTTGLTFNNIREDSKAIRLREEDFPNEKIRKNFDASTSSPTKGHRYSPFSLITTTVDSTYNNALTDNLGVAADITNLHDDVYAPNYEVPLQGPFTEKHVGGRGHRHVDVNKYDTDKQGTNNLDGKKDRVEAWKLTHPSTGEIKFVHQDVHKPRASYARDGYAKRPVNIRNIRTSSSISDLGNTTVPVATMGNYSKDYEIIGLTNRSAAKRAFVKQEGFDEDSFAGFSIDGTSDIAKPDFSISGAAGRTEFAFVQRFSAPGGPETSGDSRGGPGVDFYHSEYSPYNSLNYRNLTVRLPLRTMLSSASGRHGFTDATTATSTDYSGDANFHKSYRNNSYVVSPTSTGVTDPDSSTKVIRDNFYISRAIPQSDLGYSWITASAVIYEGFDVQNSANGPRLPLRYLSADGIYSASNGYSSSLLVVSASEVGSYASGVTRVWPADKSDDALMTNFMYTDFVGLNYNIVEPITSGSSEVGNAAGSSLETYLNGLGSENFIQTNNSTPRILNALLLHRNGPYGWPSWKQVRAGQHPINRLLKRNAKLAANTSPGTKRIINEKDKTTRTFSDRFGATTVYREPPITSKYHPVVQVLGVRAEIGNKKTGEEMVVTRPVPVKSSYGNNTAVFANPDLNDKHGYKIDRPQPYDELRKLYTSNKVNRESSAIDSFVEFRYRETIYPSEQNAYLDRNRRRISFSNNFWRSNRSDRNTSRKSYTQSLTSSAWSLDATETFVDTITGSTAGILLNNTSQIHNGSKDNLIVAPYYSRLHMCESTASVRSVTGPRAITGSFVEDTDHLLHNENMGNIGIGGGHALWEAASQAGYIDENGNFVSDPRNPAYDTYDDYVQELRTKNKDMSIIPEFRISEHIDYYMNTQDGNFLAKNPKFLTIFGIPSGSDESPANSSEADFFKIYTNSDFMKHFDMFKKDHETIVEPSEISLSCKAIMRFLPYDGFYPAERTVDLATQFSKSVGPHIQYNGSDADAYPNAKFRNILTPYFAPGIIYNTIKSGIACDYPIYNMGSSAFAKKIVNPDGVNSNAKTKYYLLGTSSYGANGYIRIPFEDAVRPSFLKGIKILDNEPHPSSSLDVTASWGGESDMLYEMMSNNYHAAVPDFFLSDGNFTTLSSVPESQFESFEVSSFYGMRVRVRKSYHTPRPLNNRSEFPMPQDVPSDNKDYNVYESFTMYSRPSAFGPPVAGRRDIDSTANASSPDYVEIMDSLTGINPAFTPPYYDGECWFDIVFRASKEKHTLREIFQTASVFSLRFDPAGMPTGSVSGDPRPYSEFGINNFSMQLTSSFNLFGIAPLKSVEFDATGAPKTVKDDFSSDNNVWVMQPKFETPMLNFNDQGTHAITSSAGTLTLPNDVSASAMTPLGMWHQFGTIPDSPNKGVFFEVSDIEEEWLRSRLSDGDDFVDDIFPDVAENVYNSGKVKSLLDKVKFNKRSKRLGEIAKSKTVKEAVVAVPFVVKSGKRKFFEIPRQQVAAALGKVDRSELDRSSIPGKSIISMVKKMRDYIFPPPMDFLTYPEKIKPFAMYIFEFEHTFDQNDLSYMWQNLMPNAGLQIKEAEASISHKLLINELMGAQSTTNGQAIQSELQWMVFKVKQRAPTNYFDKVVGNSKVADRRFDFAFDVENRSNIPEFSYNWPYDFFSLVEFAKVDAEVKFSKEESDLSVSDERQILTKATKNEMLPSPTAAVTAPAVVPTGTPAITGGGEGPDTGRSPAGGTGPLLAGE